MGNIISSLLNTPQYETQSNMSKTVLITGTSSGIGDQLARIFHEKGWRVLATARKAETISELSALGITALSLDVDKPESIAGLKKQVGDITGGKLDMLINNAGMMKAAMERTISDGITGKNLTVPALDLDMDEVESCFRTNLFGV
jgi:1-acylglycerone phosphate reductase